MTERTNAPGDLIKTPCLIFAIADNTNPQSERVLASLGEILVREFPELTVTCRPFASTKDAEEYMNAKNIDARCAVHLFDAPQSGNKCFSPLHKGMKRGRITLTGPAHWGVAISTKLMEARIISAASQINADFIFNFEARVAQGKLPWGDPQTATHSGRQRREKREQRRKARQADFRLQYAF